MCNTPISEELQTFNRIVDLNWGWVFQQDREKWTQFECLNCMILESKWWLYKKDKDKIAESFNIIIDTDVYSIHFDKMVMVHVNDDD